MRDARREIAGDGRARVRRARDDDGTLLREVNFDATGRDERSRDGTRDRDATTRAATTTTAGARDDDARARDEAGDARARASATATSESDEEERPIGIGDRNRRAMDSPANAKRVAPGIRAYANRRRRPLTASQHRGLALAVTFAAYAMYHASRKPPSIVKSVLHPDEESVKMGARGWAPFDGEDGTTVIGTCDFAFLASYSVGMFFSGHIGDRMDLRKFLTFGMLMSGFWVSMFGMGYYWNVHSVWYYVAVQMVAGVMQSTGWPSVVSVMGNWFGKGKRGLIMGVWNAHTSVGNMLGSILAASALRKFELGDEFHHSGGVDDDDGDVGLELSRRRSGGRRAAPGERPDVVVFGECVG